MEPQQVPSYRYIDAGLRLGISEPAENWILSDLLGHLSYRSREHLRRVLGRMKGSDDSGRGPAAAAGAYIDMLELWSSFARDLLEFKYSTFVKYEHFEQWRRYFHDLDEDLPALGQLACEAAASQDSGPVSHRCQKVFTQLRHWHTFATGDDQQLGLELTKGVAIQHLHLAGAYPAPHHWVGLMNARFPVSRLFPKAREPSRQGRYPGLLSPRHVRNRIRRAAVIRYALFQFARKLLTHQGPCTALALDDSLRRTLERFIEEGPLPLDDFHLQRRELRKERDIWRQGTHEKLDYAQPLCVARNASALLESTCPSLLGERTLQFLLLLYVAGLRKEEAWDHPEGTLIAQALWFYIQTKNYFLMTIQQQEGYSGFDYFEYTLRLGLRPDEIRQERASWAWEVGRYLQESRSVVKLELMSAPPSVAGSSQAQAPGSTDTASGFDQEYEDLLDTLAHIQLQMSERLVSGLRMKYGWTRVGLIIHFIKGEGDSLRTREDLLHASYKIFHGSLRDRIQREADALEHYLLSASYGARQQGPQRDSHERDRPPVEICGIDTANRELYCPPEVFGPVYSRFSSWKLGRTYHVGEDFAHLTTGLRRIYEAISFLQLRPGDRLGHCIALGISPKLWVHGNPAVTMHRLDLLDDAVFEWSLLQEMQAGDAMRLRELEMRIAEHSMHIHGTPIDPHILKAAWEQRARNFLQAKAEGYNSDANIPRWIRQQGLIMETACRSKEHARSGTHNVIPFISEINDVGRAYGVTTLQTTPEDWPEDLATRILMEYLYDMHTIRRGLEQMPRSTLSELEHIVRVQELLQRRVMSLGLTVESNPSSNWLIGGFERVYDVPAVRWALTRPDFPMTINPDDPVTFSTSLENEYFLVFSCLMKGTDEVPGLSRLEALERLRRIREHSLESSFLQ